MNRVIIGVDPGQSGGVAVTFPDGMIWGMSLKGMTEPDMYRLLHSIRLRAAEEIEEICSYFAYLEKVGAMPGQGVTSMFNFGKNYGFLRGCLIALSIPFDDITPQKWQRPFGLLKKPGESKTDKKNRHKGKAQILFPELRKKITHNTADALLIMEYGVRYAETR